VIIAPLDDTMLTDNNDTHKHLRNTRQRSVILEELKCCHNHPSADEIYERVKQRLPRISLATVYRNLEVLARLGHIQKLTLSGALKRYDGNPDKHYHIRCIGCDRVDDAPLAPLQRLEDELYGATVFEIIGHNLEFIGLCPECSRKAAAPAGERTDVAFHENRSFPAAGK